MSWHGMDMDMLPLSLALSNVPNLVSRVPHTHLSQLDITVDTLVHHTPQIMRAQTCLGVHARTRACTASTADTPGHVDARTRPLTPASTHCAKHFTTPPCTAQTRPLARGNAVDDELVDDVRRGTASSHHPLVLSSTSFSRNQAQRDGIDIVHTRASSPGHQLPCSTAWTPPRCPNRKLVAAASTRSSPEEEATPGDETASRRFLIHYNVAAHHSDARRSSDALSDPLPAPPMEHYAQTESYELGNGGSLVFERDLYLVSEKLERPPPQFHGVRIHNTPGGEQQWMITADLKGSTKPPMSERILFSFKACNWVDGLAHALQGTRFAHFARHDTMGEPMALSSHPVLKHHVEHLDFMLHETRKDLELTRVHAHRAQMALAHHADAIRLLAKDRRSLRLQRAKKDATIARLREKIRTLEVTVRTQQDQIQEMEEGGEDIQGGEDFLSDDNDFEEDEFTDEEDYEFLESEEDGIIPIDVDEDDEE
ncbi:hypothetical protein QYE76_022241 [Lolium multiflorum]|uniref:Uncharacterized protein n=1 Tax=Lolium multiflorum TaxID=4521 RepID=A0AAD8RC86_LOLMU|nr:hypothetical protein QYE76_022241 [Lolium multiflorum]